VLRNWQGGLSEWQPPVELAAKVDEITGSIRSSTFFNQGGLQVVRDAWIGARVATALEASSIRLCGTERPDFDLKLGKEFRAFEVTEAITPERRRGAEFLGKEPQVRDDTKQARKRFANLHSIVRTALSKKMKKGYSPETSLVIYIPESSYGWFFQEGIPILAEATSIGRDSFNEVFVIWEGTLFSFWKGGEENSTRWQIVSEDDA
jgi:hypothetical protein